MKVFLTWYADPPDPPYWVWIRDLDGILISLSSMRGLLIDRIGLQGLKRYLGCSGTIVVDSLSTSLTQHPSRGLEPLQSWILYTQKILGADILIHKDIPLVKADLSQELKEKLLKRTILNAEHALNLSDRLGIEIMLIVQGWDLKSYEKCAEKYKELGVKYVGVGSLVPKRNNPEYVVKVVSNVRQAVGERTYLHVLGVMSPGFGVRLARYANSVDISTPMKAAVAREIIVNLDSRLGRIHLSTVTESFIYETLRGFSEEIAEKVKISRTVREMVRYIAIYNAYTIVNWLRGMVGRG
ncbi:MAG: hypothetical protein QXW58_05365 [Thermosphaera sp.]